MKVVLSLSAALIVAVPSVRHHRRVDPFRPVPSHLPHYSGCAHRRPTHTVIFYPPVLNRISQCLDKDASHLGRNSMVYPIYPSAHIQSKQGKAGRLLLLLLIKPDCKQDEFPERRLLLLIVSLIVERNHLLVDVTVTPDETESSPFYGGFDSCHRSSGFQDPRTYCLKVK